MQTDFSLYKVDMKYIRNLHRLDDKVLSVSPQTGKDTRVFVGVVVVFEKHKYCIPLSSPKKKHYQMRNSLDFSKIEVDRKLLGVLNFNLMIPIEMAQLQEINISVHRRDRSKIVHYKELCKKELEWCKEHSEIVCNKANVIYQKYLSGEQWGGRKRCLDFPKLEKECDRFNTKLSERGDSFEHNA